MPDQQQGSAPHGAKKLEVVTHKDGQLAALRLPLTIDGREQRLTVPMEADELDALIRSLAASRARLLPPHPDHPGEPALVEVVDTPPLYTWQEPMSGKPAIAIRHPGLGWLNFMLSKEGATRLSAELLRLVSLDEKPARPEH